MTKRRFPARIAVYGWKEQHNWMISEPGEVPPAWVGKETLFVRSDIADEMLEALETAEEMFSPILHPHTLKKVRAAIAKAKGEDG